MFPYRYRIKVVIGSNCEDDVLGKGWLGEISVIRGYTGGTS